MKSFKQFSEQAAAAAPVPTPKVVVSKTQPKPKVTDPSSGVDVDDKGRWKGDIVDTGKELEPGYENKVKDGKSGPDPDIISGIANPNKKKKKYGDTAVKGVGGSDTKIAGLRPDGSQGPNKVGDIVPDHKGNPMKLVPRPGYGYNQWVPVKKATGDKDTKIAGVGPYGPGHEAPTNYGDPSKIQWPRNKYKDKKAPPGPGVRNA